MTSFSSSSVMHKIQFVISHLLRVMHFVPTKLAGSSLGANTNTLQSLTLAICYSVAEYCCPVWARSAHTDLVDVQLNFTMHLIIGTLRSAPLPWLPVLVNIEPPALRTCPLQLCIVGQADWEDSPTWRFAVTQVCVFSFLQLSAIIQNSLNRLIP